LRWDIAERVLQAGFLPDTFSTDWTPEGRTAQVIDFPNVMSKFLMLGMSLDQVIACASVNASRIFPVFSNRGPLKVGAPAAGDFSLALPCSPASGFNPARRNNYSSFAYSALACFRSGMSGSAFFQSVRKSL
jgi:hypothetical protein